VRGIERARPDERRTAFLAMEDYRALGAALAPPTGGREPARPSAVRLLALTGLPARRGGDADVARSRPRGPQLRLTRNERGLSLRRMGQAAPTLLRVATPSQGRGGVGHGRDGDAYQGLPKAWERNFRARQAHGHQPRCTTLPARFRHHGHTLGCSEPTIAAMLAMPAHRDVALCARSSTSSAGRLPIAWPAIAHAWPAAGVRQGREIEAQPHGRSRDVVIEFKPARLAWPPNIGTATRTPAADSLLRGTDAEVRVADRQDPKFYCLSIRLC